jgi:hypothetical protein
MNATIQYDYKNQAWVVDGIYQACNHPESMECNCYGRIHAGEQVDDCDHENKEYTRAHPDDMYTDIANVNCRDCGAYLGQEN